MWSLAKVMLSERSSTCTGMKLLMALGGLLGFCIGLVFGLAQGSSWPSVLWRASVIAYLSGMLLRWWGRVWIQSLQRTHVERCAQQAAKSEPAPLALRPKS